MDLVTLGLAKNYTNSYFAEKAETKVLWNVELTAGQAQEAGDTFSLNLTPGEKYTVQLDSGTHESLCRHIEDGGLEYFWLGNFAIFGGEETPEELRTGENFIVIEMTVPVSPPIARAAADLNGGTRCIVSKTLTSKTIDQKYIPPLDSLTLNGADGKQYKLSVDESGQLVTAVVE